jgi:hypothetical protein
VVAGPNGATNPRRARACQAWRHATDRLDARVLRLASEVLLARMQVSYSCGRGSIPRRGPNTIAPSIGTDSVERRGVRIGPGRRVSTHRPSEGNRDQAEGVSLMRGRHIHAYGGHMHGSAPPKRAFIPGAIACFALLGLGLEAGSRVGGTATAVSQTSVYTTTVSGRIVTVKGKARRIIVPAKTIRRHGKTVTIPAHTVAITDTQVVTGPARTIDGTVIRTVRVPVTVTEPGRTDTTTQTVTGPVTTVTQTVITTVIDTTTDTVTETVTTPPTS